MIVSFDSWLILSKKSENTRQAYVRDVMAFLTHTKGNVKTPADITKYLTYLQQCGRRGSTIKRVNSALNSYFDYLIEIGETNVNIAKSCDLPDIVFSYSLAPPCKEDVDSFIKYAVANSSPRDAALVSLMYTTGATVSELEALNVGDIDMRRATIKYGNRQEVLPVTVQLILLAFLKGCSKDSPVFTGSAGSRLTRQGIWLICKKTAGLAGLDLSPRQLRYQYLAKS